MNHIMGSKRSSRSAPVDPRSMFSRYPESLVFLRVCVASEDSRRAQPRGLIACRRSLSRYKSEPVELKAPELSESRPSGEVPSALDYDHHPDRPHIGTARPTSDNIRPYRQRVLARYSSLFRPRRADKPHHCNRCLPVLRSSQYQPAGYPQEAKSRWSCIGSFW